MTVASYRALVLCVVVVSTVSASLSLIIGTLATIVIERIKRRKERK